MVADYLPCGSRSARPVIGLIKLWKHVRIPSIFLSTATSQDSAWACGPARAEKVNGRKRSGNAETRAPRYTNLSTSFAGKHACFGVSRRGAKKGTTRDDCLYAPESEPGSLACCNYSMSERRPSGAIGRAFRRSRHLEFSHSLSLDHQRRTNRRRRSHCHLGCFRPETWLLQSLRGH